MIDTPYNRKIAQMNKKFVENAIHQEKVDGLDLKELKFASGNSLPYTDAQIDRSYGYGQEYLSSGNGMTGGNIVEEVKKYIRKPRVAKAKLDEKAGMELKTIAKALKGRGRPKKAKLDEKAGMELKTIAKALKGRGRPKKEGGAIATDRKIGASKSRKELQKKLDEVLEVKEGGAKNKIDEIINKIQGKGKEEKDDEVKGGVQILKKSGGARNLARIKENIGGAKKAEKKVDGGKLIPKSALSGTNMIGGKKSNPWLDHVKKTKEQHKGKALKEILKIAKDTYKK